MAAIDLVFVVPASAVILIELYGILAVSPKIRVKGRVAGTAGSRVLLTVLAVLALLRPQDIAKLPAVYCSAMILLAIHSFIMAGPGDDAFYHSWSRIPYKDLDFYQDIRDFKGGFSARFHCRNGRDYVVLYKENQRENLAKIMDEHRIVDYDSLKFFGK